MKLHEVGTLKLRDGLHTRLDVRHSTIDNSHFLCRVINQKTVKGVCNDELYTLPLQIIPQELLGELVLISIRDLLDRDTQQVYLSWYDPEA